MKGLVQKGEEISGRRYPVRDTADRYASPFDFLPGTEYAHPPGTFESFVNDLRYEIHVRDQGRLENHTDVWSIKQFYWVPAFVASILLMYQLKLDSVAL